MVGRRVAGGAVVGVVVGGGASAAWWSWWSSSVVGARWRRRRWSSAPASSVLGGRRAVRNGRRWRAVGSRRRRATSRVVGGGRRRLAGIARPGPSWSWSWSSRLALRGRRGAARRPLEVRRGPPRCAGPGSPRPAADGVGGSIAGARHAAIGASAVTTPDREQASHAGDQPPVRRSAGRSTDTASMPGASESLPVTWTDRDRRGRAGHEVAVGDADHVEVDARARRPGAPVTGGEVRPRPGALRRHRRAEHAHRVVLHVGRAVARRVRRRSRRPRAAARRPG